MRVRTNMIIFIVFMICFVVGVGLPQVVYAASKGRLVIAQAGEVVTLDPHMQEQVFAHNVCINMFEFLVQRVFVNGKLQHKPMLATSWDVVDDKTWVFHLRKGVKFHNGEEFNAQAVKCNLERVLDPEQKARKRYYFTNIKRIEIPDPFTLKITTKVPMPTLLVNLGFGLYIAPPKYVEEKGDEYVATHPVGTGPFKFVRWVKDEEIVLEANEDYWGGPPIIKSLVFKPIPEDSTRVAALLGSQLDIAVNIPVHLISVINKSDKAEVLTANSALSTNIHMNTIVEGPLRNKKIRQALNYAVDKENIIKHILEGYGKPLGSPLTPAHFGYNPNVNPYPYNPEKAKALLSEAGYAKGLSLTLNVPAGRYVKDKEIGEAITGYLKEVGIDAKMQVWEWANYMKQMYSEEGLRDMYMIGWAGNFDADGILYPTLHCGMRFSRYCDKKFDSYLDQARSCLDQQKREDFYQEAVRYVHDEAPWIFLHYGIDSYGVSKRVQNWKPTPDICRTLYMHETPESFPSVKD